MANEILGLGPGQLFVHRNVANMVVPNDTNLQAVLNYGVNALQVKHIVVCGHYDCGGIKAALKPASQQSDVLDSWLQNIRDVIRLHQEELDAIEDLDLRHRRLVELNVIEQCVNLFKQGCVQKKRLETFDDENQPFTSPRIHGFVFDPENGQLHKLKIDFRRDFGHLRSIYNLTETEDGIVVASTIPINDDHPWIKAEQAIET